MPRAHSKPRELIVLPRRYAKRILLASFLMIPSGFAALWNGLMDNAFLNALVFSTSVNYWRRPTLGWRRNVDMVCATGSLAYQLLHTSRRASDQVRALYFGFVVLGGAFYLSARTLTFYYRDTWGDTAYNVSSAAHCCLHLCGNLGNLVLYGALGVSRTASRAS